MVSAAVGSHILKVIIETCLLTDAEKEKMCDIVPEAGADYIKTSTGFSTGGATLALAAASRSSTVAYSISLAKAATP